VQLLMDCTCQEINYGIRISYSTVQSLLFD
jgi:hypothetical protein